VRIVQIQSSLLLKHHGTSQRDTSPPIERFLSHLSNHTVARGHLPLRRDLPSAFLLAHIDRPPRTWRAHTYAHTYFNASASNSAAKKVPSVTRPPSRTLRTALSRASTATEDDDAALAALSIGRGYRVRDFSERR
jgi:hypothetical protein